MGPGTNDSKTLRMMDSKIFLDMIELTKGTGGDCDAYSSHCRFVQNSKDDGSPQPGEAMDRTAESPRPDKLIPSQSHPMLQIAFTESARYARSVSQSPPSFQKCMARAPVSPCAPPRVFRGKASSWGHGEISRIHEPCRADEAARLMKPDKGSGASATAPGQQPSMAHAAALFYARFRVATGLCRYGVDWGCRTPCAHHVCLVQIRITSHAPGGSPGCCSSSYQVSCDDRQGLFSIAAPSVTSPTARFSTLHACICGIPRIKLLSNPK